MVCNDNSFKEFQKLLKTFGYDKIPKTPYECNWKVDSYDLCQGYLKRYRVSPDVLEIISKFIPIEKYYWTTITLFPTNYLGYEREDKLIPCYELSKEENRIFQKQIENMVQIVYENQRALGCDLEWNYMEIGSNILANMVFKNE